MYFVLASSKFIQISFINARCVKFVCTFAKIDVFLKLEFYRKGSLAKQITMQFLNAIEIAFDDFFISGTFPDSPNYLIFSVFKHVCE